MDETDAVLELVDILARRLGYDYVTLSSCGQGYRRCVCAFRRSECFDHLKIKTADGQLKTLKLDMPNDSNGSNGKIFLLHMYYVLARKLYRNLDNGIEMYVDDKKLEASMVPEFMVKCVLNGVV